MQPRQSHYAHNFNPEGRLSLSYFRREATIWATTGDAAVFRNGRNQTVRIPRAFELPGEDAVRRKEVETLIIEPAPPKSLLAQLASLPALDDEFPPMPDTASRRALMCYLPLKLPLWDDIVLPATDSHRGCLGRRNAFWRVPIIRRRCTE